MAIEDNNRSEFFGSGSITALNGSIVVDNAHASTVVFQVSGTWVATIRIEGSTNNGTTWQLLNGIDTAINIFATFTTNGVKIVSTGGFTTVRLTASAFTSGQLDAVYSCGPGLYGLQVYNSNAASLKMAPRSDFINSSGSAGSLNADAVTSIDVEGYQSITIQITGTWVGTLAFQGSDDNSTFVSVNATDISDAKKAPFTTTTANGLFYIPLIFRYFRLRMTSYTSGTATSTFIYETMTPPDVQGKYVNVTDGTRVGTITPNNDFQVQFQNSFTRVTGNTTSTAKSGAGILHGVIVGDNTTGGIATIYDNTAGSGTIIMQLDFGTPSGGLLSSTGQAGPVFLGPLGINFSTGLTAVTAGDINNDITLVYK